MEFDSDIIPIPNRILILPNEDALDRQLMTTAFSWYAYAFVACKKICVNSYYLDGYYITSVYDIGLTSSYISKNELALLSLIYAL